MIPIPVESIDDPRVAPYRDLPSRKWLDGHGKFIAEGSLVVQRLLDSQYEVDSILVDPRRIGWVRERLQSPTPVFAAPREILEKIIGFNFHQGIMACGHRSSPRSLAQVLPRDRERMLIVVCADIQDPENLGAILRNCAAFGADAVIVNNHCTSPFSRRVLRVSMGTVFRLPLVETGDLQQQLRTLREQWKIRLSATLLSDRAIPLERVQRFPREAILFGNEANGLGAAWVELCDREITIPMRNGTDSLNVAVASGIFLYHLSRCAGTELQP